MCSLPGVKGYAPYTSWLHTLCGRRPCCFTDLPTRHLANKSTMAELWHSGRDLESTKVFGQKVEEPHRRLLRFPQACEGGTRRCMSHVRCGAVGARSIALGRLPGKFTLKGARIPRHWLLKAHVLHTDQLSLTRRGHAPMQICQPRRLWLCQRARRNDGRPVPSVHAFDKQILVVLPDWTV